MAYRWLGAGALALLLGAGVCAEENKTPYFSKGEEAEAKDGIVWKDTDKAKDKKKGQDAQYNERAVQTHIKNLSDPDPEVAQNSAWMLGTLGSMEAVPFLIEALKSKHIMVQLSAHGALNKLTGKNFGYKNYDDWKSWYTANKKDIQDSKVQGAGEMRKINAKYNNTLGLESLHHGEFSTARGYFLKAVNMDPEIPDYRNNLGLSVMELGSYVDAINYFEEALGIDNELPQPYMNIGSCFARMNKTIEAQHWFRKAVEKDKKGDLWETCWSLGKEYLRKGDFQMSQEFLELARDKAAKNRIYDPRIYRDLAQVYYGLDQYHTAWMTILFVRQMNYELNEDFVEKVRKQLIAQGIDPDKIDPSANPVNMTGEEGPTQPQPAQENTQAPLKTPPSEDTSPPKKKGLKLNAESEK